MAAIVNDQVISFSDVRSRARLILVSIGAQPNEETIAQAQARALQSLIDEKLKMLESAKFELSISDEEIDAEIAALAERNNATTDQLTSDLQQRGISLQTLRNRFQADLAWRRLISGLYGGRVRISDAQVDGLRKRWSRSQNQEQFRIAEIFLPARSEQEKAAALRGAWSLHRQIVAGAPFRAVAQQYSRSATAATGGELGWIAREDLRPDLAGTVTSIESPGMSEPVITADGVYLIAVIERRLSTSEEDQPVQLKQIAAWGDGASDKIARLSASVRDCASLTADAETDGITVTDLGETIPSSLNDAAKQAILATVEGRWTDPISLGGDGVVRILVCEKNLPTATAPDRQVIANQLFEQQLAMLSNRHLRNVRREATIIRR